MNQESSILIVDDMEVNRALLSELFKNKYNILEAENGQKAMDLIRENSLNIAIILLDIVMPVMDGFEVLELMHKENFSGSIPVILITGDNSVDSEKKGYDLGVSDVIRKPFDQYIVKRRIENVIDLYQHKNHLEFLVKKQTKTLELQSQKLKENNEFVIDTLSTVVEFRSLESGQHIHRIRHFTKTLLEYVAIYDKSYNLTPRIIEIISSASAMHDIGKIAIPDSILLKPGRLTDEEFDIMKTHTTKGCEILDSIGHMQDKEYFQYSYNICRHHHERWDGKGYPDGLKEDEIPVCAQVVSIADVYDALVSERVYKRAYTPDEAIHMILNGECGTFSPKLIECFKHAENEFKDMVNNLEQ